MSSPPSDTEVPAVVSAFRAAQPTLREALNTAAAHAPEEDDISHEGSSSDTSAENKSEDDLELYNEMHLSVRDAAYSLRTCKDAGDAIRYLKKIEQAIVRDSDNSDNRCGR